MRIIKYYLLIFLIIIGCESENTNFIEIDQFSDNTKKFSIVDFEDKGFKVSKKYDVSDLEEVGFKNVKSNSFFMTKVWSAVK